MHAEQLKARTLESFDRLFNHGDLDFVDASLAPDAVDHQEPDGTDFAAHLKHVDLDAARGLPRPPLRGRGA